MKWFRSSNGAVLLSFFAMLSLLFRSFIDTAYILPGIIQVLELISRSCGFLAIQRFLVAGSGRSLRQEKTAEVD